MCTLLLTCSGVNVRMVQIDSETGIELLERRGSAAGGVWAVMDLIRDETAAGSAWSGIPGEP